MATAKQTTKQDVQRVLDHLPEETSLEDVQYHLYVLQRIERGRKDIEAGRVIPQAEVERRMAKWLGELGSEEIQVHHAR